MFKTFLTEERSKAWLWVNNEGSLPDAELFSSIPAVIKAVLDQMEDDFESDEEHKQAYSTIKTLEQLSKFTAGTLMEDSIIVEYTFDGAAEPKVTRL